VCVQVIYPLGRAVGRGVWNKPHKCRRKGRSRETIVELKKEGRDIKQANNPTHETYVLCRKEWTVRGEWCRQASAVETPPITLCIYCRMIKRSNNTQDEREERH
jgi:hypothetical protein